MRRLAPLLLLLAACGETPASREPPTDRFYFPTSLAMPRDGNGRLLVVSTNKDLRYDGAAGGTIISFDPVASIDTPGVLVDREAVTTASYGGPLAVADSLTCPELPQPLLLMPSRYDGKVHRFGMLAGTVVPAADGVTTVALGGNVSDPFATVVACRPGRSSALVAWLRSASAEGIAAGAAYVDLIDLAASPPTAQRLALGMGTVTDMAYDPGGDRVFAVANAQFLTAPLHVIDLCGPGAVDCAPGLSRSFNLSSEVRGADPEGIALSTPGSGPLRAYVLAKLYDADLAAAIGGRPSFDIGGAILVVDLSDGLDGSPRGRVLAEIPVGTGSGQIRVVPRTSLGLRDLVVTTSAGTGEVNVYDDEVGLVVSRVIARNPATGASQVGKEPFGLAVDPVEHAGSAWVYVASFDRSYVSRLDIPLATPGLADLARTADGLPKRIGSER